LVAFPAFAGRSPERPLLSGRIIWEQHSRNDRPLAAPRVEKDLLLFKDAVGEDSVSRHHGS
jgi:hypothetical protein